MDGKHPYPDPFAPVQLGPIRLRNRFIKSATFEGLGDGHTVGDDLIDFHQTVAEGGVGLTTLAFCVVSPGGRAAPKELVMSPEIVPSMSRFAETINATGAKAAIQLGHAGPVAGAVGKGAGLAPSRVFSPQAMGFTREATDDEIVSIIDDFGTATSMAVEAGISVIELHFGHGYLVSSFLSPKLNRRKDRWGGTVKNRALLARMVAEKVRERAGSACAVTAKLNMADGVPRGLWLDESIEIAQLLESDGNLDALELSGGSSFEAPMYLLRGDAPVDEMARIFPQPMSIGLRLTAWKFMPTLPYEEAFFLPFARQFRDSLSMPLILLGGINKLETVNQAMADGFDFVAMARALLREPDLVNQWQKDEAHQGLCVHCNKCIPTIYGGTHCVLVPPERRPGVRVRTTR